jgi:Zn-dependent M16 (insulinase) family peptidase
MNWHFLENPGDKYLDFIVTKSLYIDELKATLKEITHAPSSAKIIHIGNDDRENLFCLSFKTLPKNSNGVAHILEHTVLCGSKKFPVKDPFFSMTRRSLNTFMNALTGADFTCYPAASQVEKDFYNLFEVYIDAVFHPELKEMSFLQEGCRLEFTKPSDPKSPLCYKGIVFNEMQGAMSSADARLWHAMLENLVPDLPYAYNSGGDPEHIPSLSYEELLAFYHSHYHPSRCLFFLYGNLPLKGHLDFLDKHALQGVKPLPPLEPIAKQRRFLAPIEKTISYPVTEEESLDKKTMISFGWLTTSIDNQEEMLALIILDAILMETDASPLKKRLLSSGLCSQVDAYIDTEMTELPYIITCKGCSSDSAEKLQASLIAALEDIAKNPIDEELIKAAIHQIELSRLEIGGDSHPFGLTLFFRSALAKQHGCEPENALVIYSLFEKISHKAKDPSYLQGLMRKMLIENSHRVRITFVPDKTLESKELQEAESRLEKLASTLSSEQKNKIIQTTQALDAYQKSLESLSLDCLPKVTLDDVPLLARQFPLYRYQDGSSSCYHHDVFTNHITYLDLCFNLPKMDLKSLPLLQLMLHMLPELGAGKRDYAANLEYIQAHTGGVSIGSSWNVNSQDGSLHPYLFLRGKSLAKNSQKLCHLFIDILKAPHITDKKRIKDLLSQIHTSLEAKLTKNAMRYAIHLALSSYHKAAFMNQQCYGIPMLETVRSLAKDLDAGSSILVETFTSLKEQLFTFEGKDLIVGADKASFEELQSANYFGLLSSLPSIKSSPFFSDFSIDPVYSQARTIAAQVSYNIMAMPAVSFIHPHAASLMVATQLLENKVLLNKIREKGGAYGASASFNPTLQAFYFHSYRDPNIAKTQATFIEAAESIASGAFSQQDLEEAKLGILQHLDNPVSPGSRAMLSYSWMREGKTQAMRQGLRDAIIGLSSKTLQHAVAEHVCSKLADATMISFAGRQLLEKENITLGAQRTPLPIFSL